MGPRLDGDPFAILLVTPRFTCADRPENAGVFCTSGTGEWAILTEDCTDMPIGSEFHVVVRRGGHPLPPPA